MFVAAGPHLTERNETERDETRRGTGAEHAKDATIVMELT